MQHVNDNECNDNKVKGARIRARGGITWDQVCNYI